MKKQDVITVVVVVSLLLAFVILTFVFIFYKPHKPGSIFFPNNTVINVIDGDTFEYVEDLGSYKVIVTVRLLCVDTPEENQTGYQEAKEYLEELILNEQVTLVPSTQGPDKDAYGRTLRYIYTQDGTFVNKRILELDYGELLIIPPEDCEAVK